MINQDFRWLMITLSLMIAGFGEAQRAGATLHDGPDPVAHWLLNERHIDERQLKARLGPDGVFNQAPQIINDAHGQAARFHGRMMECVIANDSSTLAHLLPQKDMTISAWVSIDAPETWGGIFSAVHDNGEEEAGWVLGYNETVFTFALASVGANDGNGKLTYLAGKTEYQRGRWYHVVGVYDGNSMQLYVDGQLDAESSEQTGDILYPASTPVVLGAYRDSNEFHPLRGRVREVALYDLAAQPKWVAREFSHQQDLTALPAELPSSLLEFRVKPFLQYGTETGMTIVWQTSEPSAGTVYWGEDIACSQSKASSGEQTIHQVRLEQLQPETQYFYRVESSVGNAVIESEPSTFQTACQRGTPIAFAVISDTQDNLPVASQLAALAWAQRPHFLLHPGDLVDQGKQDEDWLDQFFPSMEGLISRVPLFPVLGNHEQNAKNYFDYMALPDPEYYYQFSYGDADFFMIDSNRNVDPDSEQYRWLDEQLAKSTATWKFVCHHHPPYSSDENDYGDLWKTNRSTRGDLRVRQLVALYERHGVDIVWNGHIHSYERTWPIRDNQSVEVDGTIYMITGGGGGGLEAPGPYRPFFQNHVRRGHHYTMVYINGGTLELKSYTLDDRLFDHTQLKKARKPVAIDDRTDVDTGPPR